MDEDADRGDELDACPDDEREKRPETDEQGLGPLVAVVDQFADDGSEEWARAVMAACEVDAAYGCSGGIMEGGGFTVGSFSWNPGTEGASTYRSDMEAAVRRELLGTPLLYAGIGGTR